MTKKREKLLDKFVKKDYNNDLEELLSRKHFQEEVKNLLLDSLYKTENAYKDYATVKKNVPTIDEYIQNIILSVKKSCDEIELTKPKYGETPSFSIDKKSKKIICFPSSKLLLYSIVKIQKHDDIIKSEPDFLNYALTNMINKGNCINNIEPIRDFNGFSWNSTSSDIEDYYSNLIYQDLIILSNNKLIEEWVNKNDDMIDYMDLFKEDLEKKYGKKYQKEIVELLKIISVLMEVSKNSSYKKQLLKRKKNVKKELEAMKDTISYLGNITTYKKQILDKIRKLDIVLSNNEQLTKEYEKRNKDLPLQQKIFSKNVLKKQLKEEREELLAELEECNDKMNSKKFIKIKEKYKYEYEYLKLVECKNVEEEIENCIALLQKRVLQAIKLKIKNASTREKINKIIYELRYFCLIPIYKEKRIIDSSKLNRMLISTQTDAIEKAYELRAFRDIFKDKSKNIYVLKYLFNLKIIKLEDLALKIIKENDKYYVQFFDDDIIDEIYEIDRQINKKDLKIRLNKKINVFDL